MRHSLQRGQLQATQRHSPQPIWQGWMFRSLAIIVLASAAMILTASWWLPAIGLWLARPATVAPVDAIVVLGGRYPYRDQHGIDLYQQGLAREIWRTGPIHSPGGRLIQAAQQLALDQGVPADAYFMLESYSTWDDGQQIAALAREREVQHLLIVTDWAHSRRALCVIRQHLAGSNVTILYDPPRQFPVQAENWWQHPLGQEFVIGELVKTAYYWLRYGTSPFGC